MVFRIISRATTFASIVINARIAIKNYNKFINSNDLRSYRSHHYHEMSLKYTEKLVECMNKAKKIGITEDELNAYTLKKYPSVHNYVAGFAKNILSQKNG